MLFVHLKPCFLNYFHAVPLWRGSITTVDYKRFSHTRAVPQCRQGLVHQFPVTSGMLTFYHKMILNVSLSLVYKQNLCFRSDQIRSVAHSCPTLCDPMNRSTPGLPVHHQLPEFTQTHVSIAQLHSFHTLAK